MDNQTTLKHLKAYKLEILKQIMFLNDNTSNFTVADKIILNEFYSKILNHTETQIEKIIKEIPVTFFTGKL